MWVQLIALALFIIFVVLVVVLFAKPLVVVSTNAVILYFIGLKIHADITKRKMRDAYIKGGLAAAILLLVVGNFLPLWLITTWIILTLAIVKIVYFLKENKKLQFRIKILKRRIHRQK